MGNGVIVQGEAPKVINLIESTGNKAVQAYVKSRMQTKSVPITSVKKNATFFNTPDKKRSKQKNITLKEDVALFSTLFIVSQQQWKGNLSEFFAHEIQGQPSSLSLNNNLRPDNKASLKYFEEHVDNLAPPVIPSHNAYG